MSIRYTSTHIHSTPHDPEVCGLVDDPPVCRGCLAEAAEYHLPASPVESPADIARAMAALRAGARLFISGVSQLLGEPTPPRDSDPRQFARLAARVALLEGAMRKADVGTLPF